MKLGYGRYPGSVYTHLIQQSLESGPSVATTLTAPIEPLEQDALAPVEELSQAGRIANNPVIVPVPPIFRLQERNNHSQAPVSVALDPGAKGGKRGSEFLPRRPALDSAQATASPVPIELKTQEVESPTGFKVKTTETKNASLILGH